MDKKKQWITPFLRQCFVTSGVSINMSAGGFVMGFATPILEQLRQPGSLIPIDDSSGSWIAALPGIAVMVGNFTIPVVMAKYGRKTANIISIIPLLVGWISIFFARNIPTLLVARFLQGCNMGMGACISSTLIGEYTSPWNRGVFLMTISISIAASVLLVHTLGAFLSWQMTALGCALVALIDLLIVLCSPESPSWLAEQGRYDECRRVFRWLRGDQEEEELTKIIDLAVATKEAKKDVIQSETIAKKLKSNLMYVNQTIRKKEFYKPILIMIHLYTISQWSSVNILVPYPADLFRLLIGPMSYIPLLVATVDANRIIANTLSTCVIKRIKRRTLLKATGILNILGLLATAAYSYAKEHQYLRFDHPAVGICLAHVLMFAVATGSQPLCFILAGEIFPLEYRSLAGGISILFYSSNMFITVKTFPLFLEMMDLSGTLLLYGIIMFYCLLFTWRFMPETKDRTLQDIEEEFRGKPSTAGLKSQMTESINSTNSESTVYDTKF